MACGDGETVIRNVAERGGCPIVSAAVRRERLSRRPVSAERLLAVRRTLVGHQAIGPSATPGRSKSGRSVDDVNNDSCAVNWHPTLYFWIKKFVLSAPVRPVVGADLLQMHVGALQSKSSSHNFGTEFTDGVPGSVE
jgi:hypothetical protein